MYELGNAEIEELHVIIRRDHDVSGLEVTVNDAAAVRARKRIRNLYGVTECVAQVQAVGGISSASVRPGTYSIAMKLVPSWESIP